MPAYAVIGGQWGDEGKGKVVDYLAENAHIVARYAGGNNAGHTVINDRGEFNFHLIPCGVFWPQVTNVIGNGVVLDPEVLMEEIDDLVARGIGVPKLVISDRAHVIMPYHTLLDQLEEVARGGEATAMADVCIPDGDIHNVTAARMVSIPVDQVDKDKHRRVAKIGGFGTLYGLTPQVMLPNLPMENRTLEFGEWVIAEYFRLYPGIGELRSRMHQSIRRHGRVWDMWGRMRPLAEVHSPRRDVAEAALREGFHHAV